MERRSRVLPREICPLAVRLLDPRGFRIGGQKSAEAVVVPWDEGPNRQNRTVRNVRCATDAEPKLRCLDRPARVGDGIAESKGRCVPVHGTDRLKRG
jgi:hypothetical protein